MRLRGVVAPRCSGLAAPSPSHSAELEEMSIVPQDSLVGSSQNLLIVRLDVLYPGGDRTLHDCQVSSGPPQVTQPPNPVNDPTTWNSVGGLLVEEEVVYLVFMLDPELA